jgi:hypothetical protein
MDYTYLEPGQGFNIELLHEGEAAFPTLSGIVIGIPSGFNHLDTRRLQKIRDSTLWITFAVPMVFAFSIMIFYNDKMK